MIMKEIDGKWFAVETWSIEDVLNHDNGENDLTEDEAADVLERCCDYHDCNQGMSWDLISWAIDRVVEAREETEA